MASRFASISEKEILSMNEEGFRTRQDIQLNITTKLKDERLKFLAQKVRCSTLKVTNILHYKQDP